MISRRQFLKAGVATAAVASVGGFLSPRKASAFYQSSGIPLFKTPLRAVGPGQIPVAAPDSFPAPVTGVTHYSIGILQYQDQLLPSGFNNTTLWGYTPLNPLGGGIQPPKHLGGIIVGEKGKPIQFTFYNLLAVNKHIIPVDTTIPGANQAVNRTAVHFHGGLVPWISDGGPFDWWNFQGQHGSLFLNNKVLNPLALPNAAEYYYPLNQTARFGWYHDHAVGITRLNAYAGVASALLIRDNFERNLQNQGLPPFIETSVLGGTPIQELPLVIQDKIFVGPDINSKDPRWSSMVQSAAAKPGSLWYAHTYDPTRWELVDGPSGAPPDPSSIPEFFGDTMLVNGTAYPEMPVEPRRYRLRFLDACNARFLNLQLYLADGSPEGITLNPDGTIKRKGGDFVNAATGDSSWLQIGTEGGFLSKPVKVPCNVPLVIDPSTNLPIASSLIVAPAERPDLIVDFKYAAGKYVIVYNDAPAPFPGGDDRNDYFPGILPGDGTNGVGNPANSRPRDGKGPNTRVLMRFKVGKSVTPPGDSLLNLPSDLTNGIDPTLLPSWGWTDDSTLPWDRRPLSLNEWHDEFGRLIQILGNDAAPQGSPYFGNATYADYPGQISPVPVGHTEEVVHSGDTEIWEVYNTTADVHPMHFHLVNVQVINRQVVDLSSTFPYNTAGPVLPPADNELGWKDTVPMYPGTVTRVIMRFDLSPIVDSNGKPVNTKARPIIGQLPITNGMPPLSPRTGGHEYVWHCHILEHEEHDMMHAMVVMP